MPIIMVIYYIFSICLIGMLFYNFIKEKENKTDILLYLIVAIPFILRVLRIK
jgi:predicted membrane channel-forming protein YqfA (hemolysin III family)